MKKLVFVFVLLAALAGVYCVVNNTGGGSGNTLASMNTASQF